VKKTTPIGLSLILTILLFSTNVHSDELSLDEATTIMRQAVNKEGQESFTRHYQKYGFLYQIDNGNEVSEKYRALERAGYIRILPDKSPSDSSKMTYGIQFTEKAAPYLTYLMKKDGDPENMAYVSLAKVDTVEVLRLKKTAPKEYKAEVVIGLRLTPFGEVLLGRGVKVERREDAVFEANDDGWRVKFKIHF
jgi:hypothetical protein